MTRFLLLALLVTSGTVEAGEWPENYIVHRKLLAASQDGFAKQMIVAPIPAAVPDTCTGAVFSSEEAQNAGRHSIRPRESEIN